MNFLLRRRGLGYESCHAIEAQSTTGLKVVRNDAAIPEGEIVFRWGCTSNVRAEIIINKAKAIHAVTDKREFRLAMNKDGLCPKTWTIPDDKAVYPCVVRPRFHDQGQHLYVCHNARELNNAWRIVGGDGYVSELINKVAEYRVFFVSGKVPCVLEKFPNARHDVAWNLPNCGAEENVRWNSWPIKAIEVALKAFQLSGLDFGVVDVIVDKAGTPYVLEINSAPSLTSPYRQKCMTRAFDWIVKNGHAKMIPDPKRRGYGRFIHPAVT